MSLAAVLRIVVVCCRSLNCKVLNQPLDRIQRHTHTNTTVLWLSGLCPGNIRPLTPIVVISHPLSTSSIHYDLWHLPFLIYVHDSLFTQSLFKFSLVLRPSSSYSTHSFTQSFSSFCSTCPCHGNLFSCSTEIMSSNPSLSLNPLLLHCYYYYNRFMAPWILSGTTGVNWYQKGKTRNCYYYIHLIAFFPGHPG